MTFGGILSIVAIALSGIGSMLGVRAAQIKNDERFETFKNDLKKENEQYQKNLMNATARRMADMENKQEAANKTKES